VDVLVKDTTAGVTVLIGVLVTVMYCGNLIVSKIVFVETAVFSAGDVRRVRHQLCVSTVAVTVCCVYRKIARMEIREGIVTEKILFCYCEGAVCI